MGGKILTPYFDSAPVQYEAGTAEFYDYSPVNDDPLKELITVYWQQTTTVPVDGKERLACVGVDDALGM